MKGYFYAIVIGLFLHPGTGISKTIFKETFEKGSKSTYKAGNVSFPTGLWILDNARTGNTASDHKHGKTALRLLDKGKVSMLFDINDGAAGIHISHAAYGTDPQSTWELWYSVNKGKSWTKAGNTITTSSASLSTAGFSVSVKGPVRFQVRKLGGGRLNLDDFQVLDTTDISGQPTLNGDWPTTRDDNMGMGNPSNATTDISNPDNYLIVKTQYALSYNNSKGIANWVSWHLSMSWKSNAARCDCFKSDNTLPSGFFRTMPSDYTSVGFDRGHLCPSDDRDGSDTDNAITFLMTNMTPQAPILNEQVWMHLEEYCRSLASKGNELYIIAGGYGQGGIGANGGTTNTIGEGHIVVPAHFWKVIVVLPVGADDANRVSNDTRVIAVDMPNSQSVNNHDWDFYRTSVDAIEAATGYDFLTNVPKQVQKVIEARVDDVPIE